MSFLFTRQYNFCIFHSVFSPDFHLLILVIQFSFKLRIKDNTEINQMQTFPVIKQPVPGCQLVGTCEIANTISKLPRARENRTKSWVVYRLEPPPVLVISRFFYFFFFTTSVPSCSPYELRARDRQVEKEFAVLECDSGKLLKKTQMHLPVPRTFTVFRSHQCANSFCTTFSDHTDRKVGVFLFTVCIVKTGDGQGNVKVFVL